MKKAKRTRIIFRADGVRSTGLGHVYRALSLAQICKTEFDCVIVTKDSPDSLRDIIKAHCPLIVLKPTNEVGQLSEIVERGDILVLDGYGFDTKYQEAVKPMVHKLVMVDDKAEIHFLADLVINHGGDCIRDNYSTEPETKLLTGFSYLISRPEFLAAAQSPRKVSKADTVFICMGGSDPFDITVKAVRACTATDFVKTIFVVTGNAYNNHTMLEPLVKNTGGKRVVHKQDLDAKDMVKLLLQSEIAICPASTVAVEACCVRTGLLSGTVIDNQMPTHEQLLHNGCCVSVGDFNAASSEDIKECLHQLAGVEKIAQIIANQEKAIDGRSGSRLLFEFKTLAAC